MRMFIEDQTSKVEPISDIRSVSSLEDFDKIQADGKVQVVFFTPEDLPGAERVAFDQAIKQQHFHGSFSVAVGSDISKSEKTKPYSVVVYRNGEPTDVWDHFAGEDLMDAIVDVESDVDAHKAIGQLHSTVPSTIPLSEFLEVALVPNIIDVEQAKIPQGLIQPNRPILVLFTDRAPSTALTKLSKNYKQRIQFVRFNKTVRHALGLKLGIPSDVLSAPQLACIVEMHHPSSKHNIYLAGHEVFHPDPQTDVEETDVKALDNALQKFLKGELEPISLKAFSKTEL